MDREQSGVAAAAESSRRDMEMKAKEESDLVHECQVSPLSFLANLPANDFRMNSVCFGILLGSKFTFPIHSYPC